MDPDFIHMDWERTFDAIMLVVVLAIVVERALSVIFQSSFYIERIHRDGMKESIALLVSVIICVVWKLDAIGMILPTGTSPVPGYIVTGALVAGGSKGSLKLFQDFLGLQSTAFKTRHALLANRAAAEVEKAKAEAMATPSKAAAERATAKAAVALNNIRTIAAKAVAAGEFVSSETIKTAEAALVQAEAAAKSKQS